MAQVNINDRSSIESLYPSDMWRQDGSRNSRGKTTQIYGLKILSEPGPDGSFELAPMVQHVGERDPEGDSVFVPAYAADATAATSGSTYDNAVEPAHEGDSDGYRQFIDRVIEAAKKVDFKDPIGRGEERLKGFHGG